MEGGCSSNMVKVQGKRQGKVPCLMSCLVCPLFLSLSSHEKEKEFTEGNGRERSPLRCADELMCFQLLERRREKLSPPASVSLPPPSTSPISPMMRPTTTKQSSQSPSSFQDRFQVWEREGQKCMLWSAGSECRLSDL